MTAGARVVVDLDHDAVRRVADGDGRRDQPGVLDDVGERFLDDSICLDVEAAG
jgi:hypothetical protein